MEMGTPSGLNEALFAKLMVPPVGNQKAIDAVNEFTRNMIRERGIYRRSMLVTPPTDVAYWRQFGKTPVKPWKNSKARRMERRAKERLAKAMAELQLPTICAN